MVVCGQPSLLRSNTRTTLVSVAIVLEAPLHIPTIFMPNLTLIFYHRPRYSKADLWFLSHRYPYRDEVDLGFHALKDQTVKAEVRRYRGLDARISNLLYDLQQLEERLGLTQMEKDQCVRRLEQANTLERMAEANGRNIAEARGRVTELLQDMERGRST
jgi:hypothetical protein